MSYRFKKYFNTLSDDINTATQNTMKIPPNEKHIKIYHLYLFLLNMKKRKY